MKLFIGCSSSNDIDYKYRDDCEELLSMVLKDNDLVVSADNTGIMGLAQRVAKENQREVIGICHSLYLSDISKVDCDKKIVVDTVFDRTDQLLHYSDAILFLPGGIGTVFEIMAVIEKKRSLELDKKIIIYNSFHYFDQYCYQVKQSINDAKLKDKFSEDERKQIEIDEVLRWTNDNPAASKEEYDAKVKEVEAIFNPIMQKIYQQIGGASGGIPPNFQLGAVPSACSKGTASGAAEDVE